VGFDGKTITYSPAAEDWGAAMVLLRRRSPRAWLQWSLPLVFVVAGIANILVVRDWGGPFLLMLAALLLTYGYSAWFNGYLLRSQLRRLVGHPAALTLAEDGLHYAGGPSTGTLAWSAVHDVIVDRRVVVVTRDRSVSWAIIPRTAFGGDTEVEAFRQAVEAARDRALHASSVE